MDYDLLLLAHSWLRWIIVLAGIAAVVVALRGGRDDDPLPMQFDLYFMISLDIQLLLGIALLFVTPWMHMIGEPGTMANSASRYWTVEHEFGMLIAIVIAHVARVAGKRAPDSRMRARRLAIGNAISLVIILATMPWPFMAYGRPLLAW